MRAISGGDAWLLLVIILWNITTFILMKTDKYKAIKGKRRISEKTLFISAFMFGGVGIFTGMYAFRHKTKHWSFKIIIPLAIILNFYLMHIFASLI